ncbi:uncharacterized protein LOC119585290 [Penaeus monodon]|uniref:uncharacterized protein LOC119585290 n=1 Tax=Penaeus monodon TaxID=6687 RepID=UPI0018A76F5C|nr:uncharacterized protein LOC119585290 [Penaeus monodon]
MSFPHAHHLAPPFAVTPSAPSPTPVASPMPGRRLRAPVMPADDAGQSPAAEAVPGGRVSRAQRPGSARGGRRPERVQRRTGMQLELHAKARGAAPRNKTVMTTALSGVTEASFQSDAATVTSDVPAAGQRYQVASLTRQPHVSHCRSDSDCSEDEARGGKLSELESEARRQMKRALAKRCEDKRCARRGSRARVPWSASQGSRNPPAGAHSEDEAELAVGPRSADAPEGGRGVLEIVDVADEEADVGASIGGAPGQAGQASGLLYVAEDAVFVETVWNAFRTDVMRVISGIGSRILRPAPSALPSSPGAANRPCQKSIWRTRRPSGPSAASVPLSLPRWVTPVRRFEGAGGTSVSPPRTPAQPRGSETAEGSVGGSGIPTEDSVGNGSNGPNGAARGARRSSHHNT